MRTHLHKTFGALKCSFRYGRSRRTLQDKEDARLRVTIGVSRLLFVHGHVVSSMIIPKQLSYKINPRAQPSGCTLVGTEKIRSNQPRHKKDSEDTLLRIAIMTELKSRL